MMFICLGTRKVYCMDNRALDSDFRPQSRGKIRCKEQLGGAIKSYSREAA